MNPLQATQMRRTREQVEREYGEQKWPAMERLIDAEKRAEPDAGLARVLGRVARSQWQSDEPLGTRPFVVGGETAQMPLSGSYGAAQGIVLDLVKHACGDSTDLIMELGSGWGWHILSAWATGGPRRATYVGAEYTEAGRRASMSIAELDDKLDFVALPFDYHEPAFEGLGEREHAVVFTAHSIEQIPEVKPALFQAVRGVARRVTCLHFEPVGWQVPGYSGQGSSRAYADGHDYTRNLIDSIRAEADAGRLVLDTVVPDVFGINAKNSTTIVAWRSPESA
jgi:hypothetical protein